MEFSWIIRLERISFGEGQGSPKHITAGIDAIRQMPSLKSIGLSSNPKERLPADQFWKRYDAGEFKQ